MLKKQQGFAHLWLILLIILILGAAGFAGWKVYSNNKDKDAAPAASNNSSNAAESAAEDQPAADTATQPSADTLENIKASITSGNTAALEGYMAASVNVILAASEAYGPQTPTQAITDLQYLDNATDPWDFALPAATLASYKAGGYSAYFTDDALVGQSADKYLISFQFDSSGKINGIFMTNNADALL